ncbi:hypothetical protein CCMSSC00406_0003697 [Pleurotus cornucopiae]|uniref:Uncharacterized protein n=1 Tax=Pleurotus cornucopiae TaxID=5321 RepID=A0ACB7IQT1_PLECO|nr:hypothetical protein CCMSSC00406_0003697 [Pleurotus cornucopiae]
MTFLIRDITLFVKRLGHIVDVSVLLLLSFDFLPILASIFRQHAPLPRSAANHSYAPGLQPVTSLDHGQRDLHRRASRTDLDFEQALRGEGTVKLKEGPDVSAMGMDSPMNRSMLDSPAMSPRETKIPRTTPRRPTQQPSTPTIIPPTPSPIAGPSSAKPLTGGSNGSSAQDLVNESGGDDSDSRQTNRRSLYRSPGTSSSPDLATLMRKAKAKDKALQGKSDKLKPAATFDRPSTATRSRSSTSSFKNPGEANTFGSRDNKGKSKALPTSPEWILTSPQARGSPEKKSGGAKSSMRAKTSAFLGKVLGQNTVRERSKTDATPPTTPSSVFFTNPFANSPPVPPLPPGIQQTPIRAREESPTRIGSPDLSKPLPPIIGASPTKADPEDDDDDMDDKSMVFVEKSIRAPSPEPAPRPRRAPSPEPVTYAKSTDTSKTLVHNKRRSMSVSEFELKTAMAASSSVTPLPTPSRSTSKKEGPKQNWDDSLHGILDDFKGQLSQLDPFSPSSSLDLKDPSTPARRAAYTRGHTDRINTREDIRPPPQKAKTAPSSFALPTVKLSQSEVLQDEPPSPTTSPIIPPRTSSLYTGVRSATSGSGSPRVSARRTHSPLTSKTGTILGTAPQTPIRNKLRVQHRSTASSSEPSLIPISDDPRNFDRADLEKSVTLRRSSYFGTPSKESRNELGVNDLTLRRFASATVSPTKDDDSETLEARARDLANKCWAEDEEFLAKEKIAEWLGGTGRINKLVLHYYMDFFDFATLRLDMAFRRLCAKLYLKAETQQVDRILDEFSRRYWDCNPATMFGSASVVHAVTYSLLLLNTDLHIAELSTHMSRSQFVRNTLGTIQMQLQPPEQLSTSDLAYDDSGSSMRGSDADTIARTKRSDSITSWNSVSKEAAMAASPGHHSNGSTPSVQVSLHSSQQRTPDVGSVYGRTWEADMENLLKDMYNSVKSQQILQPIAGRASVSSLSPGVAMLRNRSLRSQPDRLATLKRGSIRGLQSILNAQAGISPYSSNSSIDGRASPSPSFATSAHDTGSSTFLTPTLGFASNLSHTIIKEAREDDDHSLHSQESGSTMISITDEELALLGPPWAKEGRLCRKQYWESTSKRAKDKAWLDVFVVIQKGELNMFTFGGAGGGGGGVVGGGNWLTNANLVGCVDLSHSLSHALPPPGYNKQRPHCMVLTLSNGGVYFFQAGTEELVNEWVSTCNYWAARTSKEPLAGGVSNMEYGWNRVLEPSHGRSVSDNDPAAQQDYSDAMSVRSGRSTRSRFGWKEGSNTVRAASSPYVDRIFINDWKPPMPPTVSSLHDEETQLEALGKHVASMKADLQKHNELREPMAALYQPRSANAMKSLSNWERKSQYLLKEIVKYDSYIDSLQAAMSLRLKKRGEKVLERALNGANANDVKWKGLEAETIEEMEEPTTPITNTHFHRRERAESTTDE